MAVEILKQRAKELGQALAAELGLPFKESYFFLVRIGEYPYNEYAFSWEPFRDLAGPLQIGESAQPVVVISEVAGRLEPEVRHTESPWPHFELRVAPTVPAAAVANAWLETIVKAGARHGDYRGPFGWFARTLHVPDEALSPTARAFLEPGPT